MGPKFGPVVLLLSAACLQTLATNSLKVESEDVPPMVAFICGKPAMHLAKEGWLKDDSTDCLVEPVEILSYCKKVYPKRDITNVVEASDKVTVDKWCRFGHKRCHHHGSHTVRPFRCLEGPFQSDALLVPEHCVFDHIHKSEECMTFSQWNETSYKSCNKRDMNQQSFAILLPCGVDRFSGVEFVCCPKEDDSVEDISDTDDEDYSEEDYLDEDLDEDEDEDEDIFDDYSDEELDESEQDESEEDDSFFDMEEKSDEESKEVQKPQVKPTKSYLKPDPKKDFPKEDAKPLPTPTDAYTEYLHKTSKLINEHQYFLHAKGDLQKHHHEKVTKMMKEWAAARQRVQEMKSTDSKAAEKLNKEITERFQKTYQALEQEGLAEKKQLVALHQQRVQGSLNEKKRHSMEHYMAALQQSEPDAAQILKALEHYIKTEQKDRMHTINHYEHLRDTEPAEAQKIRQQTLDHLAIIDQRIQQAIEMLNRVPQFSKKVQLQIEEFMKTFHEIDVSISNILIKPLADTTNEEMLQKYKEAQKEKPTVIPQPKKTPKPVMEEKSDESVEDTEPIELHHIPLVKDPPTLDATKYDDEVMEDDRPFLELKKEHIAHQQVQNFAAQENYIHKEKIHPEGSLSAMGIAIGSIAVFVIIVVGIVVLRKRAQRVPVNHGFVEVDQTAASPEERHVANMQINGYENPTYKYFEMNGNA